MLENARTRLQKDRPGLNPESDVADILQNDAIDAYESDAADDYATDASNDLGSDTTNDYESDSGALDPSRTDVWKRRVEDLELHRRIKALLRPKNDHGSVKISRYLSESGTLDPSRSDTWRKRLDIDLPSAPPKRAIMSAGVTLIMVTRAIPTLLIL